MRTINVQQMATNNILLHVYVFHYQIVHEFFYFFFSSISKDLTSLLTSGRVSHKGKTIGKIKRYVSLLRLVSGHAKLRGLSSSSSSSTLMMQKHRHKQIILTHISAHQRSITQHVTEVLNSQRQDKMSVFLVGISP